MTKEGGLCYMYCFIFLTLSNALNSHTTLLRVCGEAAFMKGNHFIFYNTVNIP